MKNIYKILATLSLIILLVFNCKKEPIVNPVKDITGQWEWIFTYKVYTLSDSNPLTPQYSGINEMLVFNTDQTWIKTENGTTTGSGTYSLGHGSHTAYIGATTHIYDSIVFYQDGVQKVGQDYYNIYNDTLVFCPCFAGRFISYTLPYNGSKYWIKHKN